MGLPVEFGNELRSEFPDCAPIRAKFIRDDRVIVASRSSFLGDFHAGG
jgi:hypothetical protein